MTDQRPAGLEFLVDVVARGSVLTAEPGFDPERVTAVLGSDFGENLQGKVMWRDYGLVEFSWQRRSGHDPWRPAGLAVQVYRLNTVGTDVLNPVVASQYRPLPSVVPFGELRAALSERGVGLVEIPAIDPGSREFWQPDSLVSVIVGVGDGMVPDRCVYSIGAPMHPEEVAARRGHANTAPLKQALRWHLLDADDQQRAQWATRRQPADPTDRTNWWLHLLLLIKDNLYNAQTARSAWAGLYLWGVEHATDTGAFTAIEAAISIASFVAELRHRDAADQIVHVLPSGDSIVRACLREVPISLDAIPDATDLRAMDPDAMRRSRQAKNLVNAAGWHADHVQDPRLTAQLAAWIAALPRLV